MTDRIQIQGGAGPFEAAAAAAVVVHVLEAERVARERRPQTGSRPPAWVRAVQPHHPDDPLAVVLPDHRGDPL
ncbi:MAG TPA: hypothetical protein VHL52_07670 [Acidimicrobiia bacterium]|nr:hypothetical protein [Acidimicrobiia bacterium]